MDNMNKLIGGMNTDVHPSSQPENTTREVYNFVPMSENGNMFSMTNESGTTKMDVEFPAGFSVSGYTVLNNDIIVVLTHPSGYSQVGYIVEDGEPSAYGNYHPVAPVDPNTEIVAEDNSELGFTQAHPVDCEARKLINGHRILYYTDNNIPFGRIDLDDPPKVGTAEKESSLLPSFSTPNIDVNRITENVGGAIKPGIYQFITRYVTASGGTTIFGIPTNPLPMVPAVKADGVDNYEGDYNDGELCKKSVTLNITDIDNSGQFNELELVVLYYEGDSSIFKAAILGTIPITSDTSSFVFTTVDTEDTIQLTKAEIEQSVVSYNKAKCIEQKDDTLFLSNLSTSEATDNLQEIANAVKVKYNILEVPFSGRGAGEDSTSIFSLIGNPYFTDDDPKDVVLLFNATPDNSSPNTDTASYKLTNISAVDSTPSSVVVDGNKLVLTFVDDIVDSDKLTILADIVSDTETYESTGNVLSIVEGEPAFNNVDIAAGFTDYVEESLTVERKGYRRGEVYSLGFVLLYNTGATSPVFHIPAEAATSAGLNPSITWPSYSNAPGSNDLGTYVSSLEYPLDQSYPGDEDGDDASAQGNTGFERNIRHHYMPELKNEPHFRQVGSSALIRIIGLEFEFTKPLPDTLMETVSDVLFVRESRNGVDGKSIFAQGLVNRMYVGASSFSNGGGEDGFRGTVSGTGTQDTSEHPASQGFTGAIREGYVATAMPLSDNLPTIDYVGDSIRTPEPGEGSYYTGFVYPGQKDPPTPGATYEDGNIMSTTVLNDQGVFFSPEVILENTGFITDNIAAPSIKPVMNLTATAKTEAYGRDNWKEDGNEIHMTRWLYQYHNCDYNAYIEDTSLPGPLSLSESRLILENENPGPIKAGRIKTWNQYGTRGLEFLLIDDDDLPSITSAQALPAERSTNFNDNASTQTGFIGDPSSEAVTDRYLYSIQRELPNQYGGIGTGKYILIDRQPLVVDEILSTSFSSVYGGDTFITKFAYINSNIITYWPYNQKNANNSKNAPQYDGNFTNRWEGAGTYVLPNPPFINGESQIEPPGWDLRANNYYFVESDINTYYRHRGLNTEDEEFSNGYFPLSDDIPELLTSFLPISGNPKAYNPQYSFDNLVKNYYPKSSVDSIITSFENRTIYSGKAAGDDILDTFRQFAQNDYYDLPSNTGPIWDSFVSMGSLYLHTTKSLWKTFAEQAATLAGSNIEDVVLGTGALFARPSQEMITTDGGYAGTISQFGGVHSQIGYIFPDVLQGKIFGLVVGAKGGMQLKEMTRDSLSTFSHKELPKDLIEEDGVFDHSKITTEESHLIDNPFMGIGFTGGYDNKLKRVWITKLPKDGDLTNSHFTLSFSTLTNNWISYHDYFPNAYIAYNNRSFLLKQDDNTVWEMNTGEKGKYFEDDVKDSTVEIIARSQGTGAYTNLAIDSETTNEADLLIRDNNFDILQVFTDRQNTGEYVLKHGNLFDSTVAAGETLIKYRNNEYRVAIPRDSVIDNSQNIFEPTNLENTSQTRERIKNDYAHIRLTYNNDSKFKFVLKLLRTIISQNIR